MRRLAANRAVHNRRKTVVLLLVFLGVWLAAGALLGSFLAGTDGAMLGAITLGAVALAACAYGYFRGAAAVLRISHAEPADPVKFPELHQAVETLATRAGLPKPRIFVIQDPAPNAFATGRDPNHAALTVTTGLLDVMSEEELEGVIGHELSHIKHHDILLLLMVSTVIGAALLLAGWAWQAAASVNTDEDGGKRSAVVFALVGAALYAIGFLIGPIIQLALSRSRESLADETGAQLATDRTGLISALMKLEGSSRVPLAFNHATAGMFIDNPLEHHQHWLSGLFDTHPPIERRIADLQREAGLPVTAIGLHERIESELRAQEKQAKASQAKQSGGWIAGLATGVAFLAGLVLTVVVLVYNLELWFWFTFGIFIISAVLGQWLASDLLSLAEGVQLWFVALIVVAGLAIEAVLYLTGLWVWVLAALIAVLVGGFLILCFGQETVAFLTRRRSQAPATRPEP